MKKLLLFDIDRTLVQGPKIDKYAKALSNLHQLEAEINFDAQGLTDKLIIELLLEEDGWADEQIEAAWPELMREIDKVYRGTLSKKAV